MERLQSIYYGKDKGYCRICGLEKELTRDHFPPNSSGNNQKIIINCGKSKIYSQNGMKYRTLCQKCNGELLSQLDNDLKKVYTQFQEFQNDIRIYNSGFVGINVNQYRIARALLGHYLAVCFSDDYENEIKKPLDNSPFYEEIRKFILGELINPSMVKIYYWYYPYDDIRFCQYEAYIPFMARGNMRATFGGLLKYYPLAYWIVNIKNSSILPNKLKNLILKDEVTLMRIRSSEIFDIDFIEKPESEAAILMSNNGRIYSEKY